MTFRLRFLLVCAVLAAAPPASAQFSFRANGLVGSGLGDWGRSTGYGLGLDEMNLTGGSARWFTTLDVSFRGARLADASRLDGMYLEASTTDTLWFKNGFNDASVTVGVRVEPCVRWLGYRQTARSIISPFIGARVGYARFEHDQTGHRKILGVYTSQGIPFVATLGTRIAWGGPPSRSLEEDPLIDYIGFELALDAVWTLWVKDRNVMTAVSGLGEDQSAPSLPTLLLRISLVYHRAPLPAPRGDS